MLNKPIGSGPTYSEQFVIRLLIAIGVLCILNFAYHFFQPQYVGHPLLYVMLVCVIGYGIARTLSLWYYYQSISVPEPPAEPSTFSVDVLTTYYPGEPYDMVVTTLKAICAITYPHTTYLCDEADDPYLKAVCQELGVIHVTRTVKVNAKAGNINNALEGARGEICLILDPDHIPEPDFLDHIVPHFTDPAVGFVQTVQAYYNKFESLVAKGAAQQTFHFYGPMMMTMNTFGTVNAIGANCTFRRAALDSIGGHAPGLAEDMHTAMLLYRNGWKSVYVPRMLARGLVPATLTAYFSQQLKWARGTFDLLVKVYPRIFTRLTARQRFHYALSSIHYLAGPVYLIGFLLPVVSLLISDLPWTGDLLYFVLLLSPVIFTSFILRFYIQKWLISDDERGFHLVGGVLEIVTWWIFTLGFVYTLFDKKVPYLPTPKGDDDRTHWSLLIPNLAIGLLSLFAVVYGLSRDFTPFSIVMSGFALLNVGFMAVSVMMASRSTNRGSVVRHRLPHVARRGGRFLLRQLLRSLDVMTYTVRKLAPFLLLIVALVTITLVANYGEEAIVPVEDATLDDMHIIPQLGIFFPSDAQGLSDLDRIEQLESEVAFETDIVSSYVPWSGGIDLDRFFAHISAIASHGARPLITWEPWVSRLPASDSVADLRHERRAMYHIARGDFDEYIVSVAERFRDSGVPVLLRFAHEFDNPDYPWSAQGGNTAPEFVAAWRRVHDIFQRQQATNVEWVWNPWRPDSIAAYFPGSDYVDYAGLTILNYGPASEAIPDLSFRELYTPFAEQLDSLPKMDVIVSEFGSLGTDRKKYEWVREARDFILSEAPEITAVVAFNSSLDENLPVGRPVEGDRLDWTVPGFPLYDSRLPGPAVTDGQMVYPAFAARPVHKEEIRGVNYKKGQEWQAARYILSRRTLEGDFAIMQQLGINTIAITDPGIFGHNLSNLAPDYDLSIIYNLWIPETIDFVTDSLTLQELEDDLLSTVAEWKDEPTLLHWNLGNSVINNLRRFHLQPELRQQRRAYLEWVAKLAERIRKLDPAHPLTATVRADDELPGLIERYNLLSLNVDALSLTVVKQGVPQPLTDLMRAHPHRFVIGDIDPELLPRLGEPTGLPYWVAQNWQHEWKERTVTTDGLLDFRGWKTAKYRDLAAYLHSDFTAPELAEIDIVLAANTAYTGRPAVYYAAHRVNGDWSVYGEATDHTLEWRLVALDRYGNATTMKLLGEGPEISLPPIENRNRYELLLTVTDGEYSRTISRGLLPSQ